MPLNHDTLEAALRSAEAAKAADEPCSPKSLPKPYLAAVSGPDHVLRRYLPDIERMAAQQMEPAQIAARLGCSLTLLLEHAREFPEVRLALTGGKARGVDEYTFALHSAATVEGEVGAMSLALKVKMGWAAPALPDIGKPQAPGAAQLAPITVESLERMAERQAALLEGPQDLDTVLDAESP